MLEDGQGQREALRASGTAFLLGRCQHSAAKGLQRIHPAWGQCSLLAGSRNTPSSPPPVASLRAGGSHARADSGQGVQLSQRGGTSRLPLAGPLEKHP